MKTVADRLRWVLEHRGVSARGLSIKAGLSPNAVQKVLERGGSANGDTIAALASAASVSAAWLMTGRGSADDVDDAQQHPDEPVAVPRVGVRVSSHEPSHRPQLRNLPDWPELLAGAQARAADKGRTLPPWVWEAVGEASVMLTGTPEPVGVYDLAVLQEAVGEASVMLTGTPEPVGVYDLAVLHYEHGWGRPRETRDVSATVPIVKPPSTAKG